MTKIYSYPLDSNFKFNNATFVLGSFESFHIGHQKLIQKAKELSDTVVVCMIKNPIKLPKSNGFVFSDLDSRIYALANQEIKNILLIDFNEEIQNMTGNNFIDSLINSGASSFVIGKDFKFGRFGQWNASILKEYFQNTHIIEHIKDSQQGIKISTKFLKENLNFGEISLLNSLLTENYKIKVTLDSEKKIQWPDEIEKLHTGIYIANFLSTKDSEKYHGILKIDFKKPSIAELILFDLLQIEGTLLGFVEIVKEIRLVIQSKNNELTNSDIKTAKEYHLEQLRALKKTSN